MSWMEEVMLDPISPWSGPNPGPCAGPHWPSQELVVMMVRGNSNLVLAMPSLLLKCFACDWRILPHHTLVKQVLLWSHSPAKTPEVKWLPTAPPVSEVETRLRHCSLGSSLGDALYIIISPRRQRNGASKADPRMYQLWGFICSLITAQKKAEHC
jgi:hypothetical protein